jgi:hypothetical protein
VWWLKPIILATREAEIGRITVGGQARQKVHKISFQPMTGHSGMTCYPTYTGSTNRRTMVWASLGIREDRSEK